MGMCLGGPRIFRTIVFGEIYIYMCIYIYIWRLESPHSGNLPYKDARDHAVGR